MIIGTAFTLFIVPSIHMLVARSRARVESHELVRAGASPGSLQRSPA